MRLLVLVLALLPLSALALDLSKSQRAEIETRIQSYSQPCVAGDETCASARMACHATGAAGAPMVGDADAWAPRVAKGIDALYASGVNGVAGTGMIARGGCGDCSDEEIHAAVDYMVNNSQ